MPREDGQFKTGHSGGPGRPRISDAERIIREEAPEQMAIWYRDLYKLDYESLQKVIGVRNGKTITHSKEPIGKVNMAKWLLRGKIEESEKLNNRVLGRPREETAGGVLRAIMNLEFMDM